MAFIKHSWLLLFVCELWNFLNGGGTRTLYETKKWHASRWSLGTAASCFSGQCLFVVIFPYVAIFCYYCIAYVIHRDAGKTVGEAVKKLRVVETYKKQKNRCKYSCVSSATMLASVIITETKLKKFFENLNYKTFQIHRGFEQLSSSIGRQVMTGQSERRYRGFTVL